MTSIAFSPDGQLLASGSDDCTIRVCNAITGQQVGAPFEGHSDSVNSVAFSPDGPFITSGSDDNSIQVWNFGGNGLAALETDSELILSALLYLDND